MSSLRLSSNRKVSPLCSWINVKGRKEAKPKIKNAFGLPAGDSCPGKTAWCGSCYAEKLQRAYTNVDKLVWNNLEVLKECGSNVNKMVVLMDEMIKSIKWRGQEKVFRIHWDGDFYSKPYTAAWAQTARNNQDIAFWVYTRSFDYVESLKGVDNIIVYLSVDYYNLDQAKMCKAENSWVKLAFCADTWEATELLAALFPEERKGPRCPELTKKIPLVSEDGVGACSSCQLCIKGVNNVRFASRP